MPDPKTQLTNMIAAMMRPLRNRVYMMISRAVVEMARDTEGMQVLKATVLAGEDRDDIERFQNYGFTSVPLKGSEALVLCPAGNREHMIAVAVDNRTLRLKGLEEGEVAIYTDEGDKIHIKRGGTIEVISAAKVHLSAPAVELGAAATESVIKGNTFQALFNAHTHIGNMGYDTAPPTAPLTGSELSTVSKTE